jgi:hypothetical protein
MGASSSHIFLIKGKTMRLWAGLVTMVLATLVMPHDAVSQEKTQSKQVSSVASNSSPLDGFTFSAGIIRSSEADSGTEPLEDTLFFEDGNFSSAICKRYNFSDAPYWIRREGDQIHFLAELTSQTDGKMVWKGTVINGKLQGTMRWTRTRWYWTVDAEHNIKGVLKDE